MSPEEQAQRLFDRVMRLAEEGKADSVQFFMPMALGAYQQLPALSLDSHFDLGLLHLATGDPASALTEADAIRQSAPTHLYGFVLRARALEANGDSPGATRAYRDFLKNETAERARRRPEYEEHSRILDAFHGEAATRR
jgi:Flp pilus assembly protein TadD